MPDVQLSDSDIARLVRSSGFSSTLHRDLVENALLIAARDRSGHPSLKYLDNIFHDLARNLVSQSVLDRLSSNLAELQDQQAAA